MLNQGFNIILNGTTNKFFDYRKMNSRKYGVIHQHRTELVVLARLLDCMLIGLTLWLVIELYNIDWNNKFTWWLLVAIISFQTFVEFSGLYRQDRGVRISDQFKSIGLAWVCVIFVFIGCQGVYPLIASEFKENFWVWITLVPIAILCWHSAVSALVNISRTKGKNSRRVAIVGATHMGIDLEKVFNEDQWMGLEFVGYYDDRQDQDEDRREMDDDRRGYSDDRRQYEDGSWENEGDRRQNEDRRREEECRRKLEQDRRNREIEGIAFNLKGDTQDLIEQAKNREIDIIYITLALRAEQRIKKIINELADTTVSIYFVPDLFMVDMLKSSWSQLRGIPVLSVYDTPFYGVDEVFKRLFDIVVTLLILVLITLPMIIISLCIKFSSRGSILFKQRRYGFNGEEIVVWKFRSMIVSEDGEKVQQATKDDPRITPLGAFLRKTSLDELPQFINVLQGRMSIVGPRPHAVTHNEAYRGQIMGYMLRHKVKPGITGLAQISGYRGETETLDKMEGRIRYDLQYIRTWSLWLDIKIILLTIFKGFTSGG
jgi:putative colanic acid biosynthesis UDP-glucose lipid carrier transferase